MDQLRVETVQEMNAEPWYEFLLQKYFRWKYTAANRYASTTKSLRTYKECGQLRQLHSIKQRLFAADRNDVEGCLRLASSIRGLGIAGASGLLAILLPALFGTVDQFLVKALAQIPGLPERARILMINPESISLAEGCMLISILRQKANELNRVFRVTNWTPRKVDMVLWTLNR